MGTDNVDIFKKIVFHIPNTRKVIAVTILLGLVYGGIFFGFMEAFAGNLIDPSYFVLQLIPLIGLMIFIAPSMISGELLYRFIPDYPRKWGYFLALCNQAIIFVYSLIFSGADNFTVAWNIVWLGVTTVFLGNFLVLLLTVGYRYIHRISLTGAVQPLLILSAFHILLGQFLIIPLPLYILNIGILILAGILLLVVFGAAEYLLAANVSNVSVLSLASALLQKKQETLEMGYPTRPEVQTLEVENEEGKLTAAAPWIHPGPLEGFGGGQITGNIIESLNGDDEGFFLHVPSTHKADPADPEDYTKILDALKKPEKIGEASKLIKKDYGEVVFYGRKFNGRKIVFMDPRKSEYDDYEISVFKEIIDPDDVLLIDLHNHDIHQERKEVWYGTETANELRSDLEDFMDEVEKLETHSYSAGFNVDLDGTPVMALVEEVDGQRTLTFGIEGNQTSQELRDLEKEFGQRFDEVLLFSTDTHRSIHQLSSDRQVELSRVEEAVERAESDVSKAEIGMKMQEAETMRLLQEDYSSLIFSINILVRLIPLGLIVLYILLIALIM